MTGIAKKIFLLLPFLFFQSFLYAETLTLSTYYPSPLGAYDEVLFVPKAAQSGNCNVGTVYFNSTLNELEICKAPPSGQATWSGTSLGFWKQTGLNLSPQNNNWNLGIGTSTPASQFHINGAQGATLLTATGNSAMELRTSATGANSAFIDFLSDGNPWNITSSGDRNDFDARIGYNSASDTLIISSEGFQVNNRAGTSSLFNINNTTNSIAIGATGTTVTVGTPGSTVVFANSGGAGDVGKFLMIDNASGRTGWYYVTYGP